MQGELPPLYFSDPLVESCSLLNTWRNRGTERPLSREGAGPGFPSSSVYSSPRPVPCTQAMLPPAGRHCTPHGLWTVPQSRNPAALELRPGAREPAELERREKCPLESEASLISWWDGSHPPGDLFGDVSPSAWLVPKEKPLWTEARIRHTDPGHFLSVPPAPHRPTADREPASVSPASPSTGPGVLEASGGWIWGPCQVGV